jgi:hypothetical protein
MNADDKLVVSSFSVFHYILKYHGLGFSIDHVLKTYEIINIHSSPELTRIVSIIINNVLHNHLRRVRNSFYRYRFSLLHEQEIHFITTISDGESAAFNFSLNAMDAVIQYYKSIIDNNQRSFPNEQFGDISIASIHIIIGNFHFWERAYDEALIHYGIASDILEKKYRDKENLAKIAAAAQFIEVQLKQGSVAERMGNYSTAAAIYMNAEEVADNFLAILKTESVHDKDSKWDVFRQPKWARNFLNLKRSALHYSNNKLFLPDNSESTDISMYRKAVLSLFMEDFHASFLNFMEVASVADCRSERSSYLGGNAYLKAGFSLLLIFSNNLYKQLINREVSDKKNSSINAILMLADLIEGVNEGIDTLVSLTDTEKSFEFEKEIKDQHETHFYNIDPKNKNIIKQAFKLMIKSSSFFSESELHINSAISNLSVVMMWEALLEMLPLHSVDELISNIDNLHDDSELNSKITEAKNKINGIKNSSFKEKVEKIRNNLIFDMQEKAFTSTGNNTGHAFSHSMKSTLSKNLGISLEHSLFANKVSTRDMVFHDEFLKFYLFQHYSVFGQAIIASIYWEEITAQSICEAQKFGSDSFKDAELLPYSIRYYATMLWLKGRNHLHRFFENNASESREEAFLAIINFFRSSQYVIKTQGESIGVILPPLFLIYYNMWEVLYRLVQLKIKEFSQSYSYEKSVLKVREEMEELFKKHNVNDISSRVFDLSHVAPLALMQLKTIEQMADLNSRNRTGILRNKYFLDDDYEDNLFNLDWCYSRFFAPSALVYGKIIESKMDLIISHTKIQNITRRYRVLPNPLTRIPPAIRYARYAGTC